MCRTMCVYGWQHLATAFWSLPLLFHSLLAELVLFYHSLSLRFPVTYRRNHVQYQKPKQMSSPTNVKAKQMSKIGILLLKCSQRWVSSIINTKKGIKHAPSHLLPPPLLPITSLRIPNRPKRRYPPPFQPVHHLPRHALITQHKHRLGIHLSINPPRHAQQVRAPACIRV